jgi:tetratricopeptide (TPR) repeat protein
VDVVRAVVERFPTPSWRYMFTVYLANLGHLARAEHPDELEEGVKLYTECLEILEELANEVEGAESHRARLFEVNEGKPSVGFAKDHPDYRAAYYGMKIYRGRYLFDLGREQEALEDFEARASARPCADAFEELAKVRILSDDESVRDLEKGAELAQRGIDADEEDRECWMFLGLSRYLRGDHAGAVEAIKHMVRERPHYAEWILAAAYHALGDEERSAAARARAEEWLRDIEAGPWGLNRLQRFCRDTALAALEE